MHRLVFPSRDVWGALWPQRAPMLRLPQAPYHVSARLLPPGTSAFRNLPPELRVELSVQRSHKRRGRTASTLFILGTRRLSTQCRMDSLSGKIFETFLSQWLSLTRLRCPYIFSRNHNVKFFCPLVIGEVRNTIFLGSSQRAGWRRLPAHAKSIL